MAVAPVLLALVKLLGYVREAGSLIVAWRIRLKSKTKAYTPADHEGDRTRR